MLDVFSLLSELLIVHVFHLRYLVDLLLNLLILDLHIRDVALVHGEDRLHSLRSWRLRVGAWFEVLVVERVN